MRNCLIFICFDIFLVLNPDVKIYLLTDYVKKEVNVNSLLYCSFRRGSKAWECKTTLFCCCNNNKKIMTKASPSKARCLSSSSVHGTFCNNGDFQYLCYPVWYTGVLSTRNMAHEIKGLNCILLLWSV